MTFTGLHTCVRVAADSLLGRHSASKPAQQPSELEGRADSLASDSSLFEDASEGFDRSISLYWNWLRATKAASRLGRGLQQADGGLILQCEHWLEAADAKHRYGTNLRPYFDYWLSQQQAAQQQSRLQQQKQQQQQQAAVAAAEAEAATPTQHAGRAAAAAAAGSAPSPATPGAPLCWSCEGPSHAGLLAGQDVLSPSPSTAAANCGTAAAAAAAAAAEGPDGSPRRTCSAPVGHGPAAHASVAVIPEAAAVVMEGLPPPAVLLPPAAAAAAADMDTGQRTPRRSCSAPRLTDLEHQQLLQLAAPGPPPPQPQQVPLPAPLVQQQLQQQQPPVAAAYRPPAKYGAMGALPAQAEGRFFYWLDEGPGKQVDLAAAGVPRSKLETERVTYLTREEREALEVVVDAATGLLQYRATGELVDTGTDLGLVVQPDLVATTPHRHQQQHHQHQEREGVDTDAQEEAEQEDTDVDEPGMSMSVAAALCMQQRLQEAAQDRAGQGSAAAGGVSPGVRHAWEDTPARGSCTPVVAPLLQTAASTPEPQVRSGSTDGTPLPPPPPSAAAAAAVAAGHAAVSPYSGTNMQQQQQVPVVSTAAGPTPGGRQGTPRCPLEPAAASSAIKDTIREKPCKWIYVLDTQRRLFVHAKYRGKFHHSSFVEGGAVLAAGGIVVQRGRILKLTADSGHYRPSFESFMLTVQQLRDMGADLGDTQLSAKHIKCPKLPGL